MFCTFRSILVWAGIFYFVLATGCTGLFYQPSRDFFYAPEVEGFTKENISFLTGDGVDLDGWVFPAKAGERKGTVIHFHGNGQNMSAHFLFSAWLTENGFDVITFDYRGYGVSAGEPNPDGTAEDGKSVIEQVCNNPRFSRQPVFIFAQSLGGAVAIPAVAKAGHAGCVKGIVLDSTFASYRGIARRKLAQMWLTWPLQYPLSFLVSGDMDADKFINDLDVPILFVHAKNDPVVPYECGVELFEAYQKPEKAFWSVMAAEHTSAFASMEGGFRSRLVAWLDGVRKGSVAR
jgi:fermentation-respiration switch protein FrsA (DUF1100 family)